MSISSVAEQQAGAEMSNAALCDYFRIAFYQVKDLPDGYAPGHDSEKYMVTAFASDFPAAEIEAIPLSGSQEAAEALAVEHLRLRERYARKRAQLH